MESQPSLGDRVGLPITSYGSVGDGFPIGIEGTVVAVDDDTEGLDICIGFTADDLVNANPAPRDIYQYKDFNPIVFTRASTKSAVNIRNFVGLIWAYHDQLEYVKAGIRVMDKSSITPKGVVCKTCNEGNPWGEPNQSDGSFICRGCKR